MTNETLIDEAESLDRVGKSEKRSNPGEDLAAMNRRHYERGRDNGHTDWVKDAKKCDDFYCGEQWDPADKNKLKQEGRPALTINMVRSTVNAILGTHATRRSDIKFKHKRNGSAHTAVLLDKVAMSILDDNHYEEKERTVFADGVIQDRGYLDVRIGFKENMQGEVQIMAKDPREVILDPDAKEYDPTTWSRVITSGWVTPDNFKATYGVDKYNQLDGIWSTSANYADDSILLGEQAFGDLEEGDNSTSIDREDKNIQKIRVIDHQYYKLAQVKYFVDPHTGDAKQCPDAWGPDRIEEFALRNNLFIHTRTERRVRWTVSADKVLLHDEWSPYTTFTIIPFFPNFRRGKPLGVVRDLISPQELVNKTCSQELHIVNTTANSGYIVEEGALQNMTIDELKSQGSKTGVVIEMARGRMDALEKIKPNSIPTGLDRISAKAQQNFRVISGVNDAMLGMESPEVSGVAIEQKKASGSVQIDVMLANLKKTRIMLAEKILELIQNFYTEERVILVDDPVNPNAPTEEVHINQIAAGEIINNITLGEYSVAISDQPSRDTYGDVQFAELIALRTAGVLIPDDRVIERSNLEDKMPLAEEVRGMQGRGTPSEEQIIKAQIMEQIQIKTLVAELDKLEAEKEQIESQALLNTAKAGSAYTENQRHVQSLEQKMQETREELRLRKELALLSAKKDIDTTAMKAAVDLQKDRRPDKTPKP